MIESTGPEVAGDDGQNGDSVDAALAELSDVAASSAHELISLQEDLDEIRGHRLRGRPWRHIISDANSPNPLSLLTRVAANVSRAGGSYRRALAVGLRKDGMQVTEIAKLFDVSRQRVSALLRPRQSDAEEDSIEQVP
jgi:hypothetical protein